ncbi:hypothetical protein U1Q18_029850 [Sarracenia purpurea var. burkii]
MNQKRTNSSVYLAGCNLKGTLPNFTKGGSLTSLDLSNNYFTNGISSFSANMSSLQNVKLSNNLLKSQLSEIKLPDGLSSLDVYSNQLSGSLSAIINDKTSSFKVLVDEFEAASFQSQINYPSFSSRDNNYWWCVSWPV